MSGTKPLAPGFVPAGAAGVSGASPTGLTAGFDLGDGVEPLQHGRADRGAVPGREAVDRGDERLAVGRRRDGQLGEAGEDDEAHAHALRLVLDELRAASCATASRFGWTSVEHIERETSSARMIDVRAYGTLRTTCGRPAANASATRPASNRATGRCRCQRLRRGSTERSSATLE